MQLPDGVLSMVNVDDDDLNDSRSNLDLSLFNRDVNDTCIYQIAARDDRLTKFRQVINADHPKDAIVSAITLGGIALTFCDLCELKPGNELSDIHIDTCYGIYDAVARLKGLQVKFFNCTFYQRLMQDDYRQIIPSSCKILLIPVNHNRHWTLSTLF